MTSQSDLLSDISAEASGVFFTWTGIKVVASLVLITYGIIICAVYFKGKMKTKENAQFFHNVWFGRENGLVYYLFWIWILTVIFFVLYPLLRPFIARWTGSQI